LTPPPKQSASTHALHAHAPLGTSLGPFDPHRSSVSIERLDLSDLDEDYAANPRYAVVLKGILTPDECTSLIALSEQREYEMALVNIGGGKQMSFAEIRNNDRAIIDDELIAAQIWGRISTVLPPETEAQLHQRTTRQKVRLVKASESGAGMLTETCTLWNAVGLNERLRFLRYDPGTFFAPHQDGSYVRDDSSHPKYGEMSLVTAQIYLNGGFEGGATRMMSHAEDSGLDVIPEAGSILLFQHNIKHEGSLLLAGRKYTIRTDVMYAAQGEVAPA